MHEVDAAVADGFVFFEGFDTFGDDFGSEGVGEGDEGFDDGEGGGAEVEVAGELHVELEDVGGDAGEEVERGVAGAEVVEGEAEAVLPVFGDDGGEVCGIPDLFGLGDFEDEFIEGEVAGSGGFEGELDAGGGAVDGSGHKVDRKAGTGGGEAEAGGKLDGADAAVLVEAVEVFGGALREDFAGGLVLGAADEGLVGEDGAGRGVDDGLKGHGEGERGVDAVFAGVAARLLWAHGHGAHG